MKLLFLIGFILTKIDGFIPLKNGKNKQTNSIKMSDFTLFLI